MTNIIKHKMYIHCELAYISTVELYGKYETMVLYEADGEEIESYLSDTLQDALKIHKELEYKYEEELYENSLDKCLGITGKTYVKLSSFKNTEIVRMYQNIKLDNWK